jgi:hypothetical protein
MEEDFYATIKLISGEEIFAQVSASEEGNKTLLIVSNPITIGEVRTRVGIIGYKIEPWLKTSRDDMFIINLDKILTISESSDVEMIGMYTRFLEERRGINEIQSPTSKLSRKMGLLGDVDDTKEKLEKIFNSF